MQDLQVSPTIASAKCVSVWDNKAAMQVMLKAEWNVALESHGATKDKWTQAVGRVKDTTEVFIS